MKMQKSILAKVSNSECWHPSGTLSHSKAFPSRSALTVLQHAAVIMSLHLLTERGTCIHKGFCALEQVVPFVNLL